MPACKRILLKLSGESLAGAERAGIDGDALRHTAADIAEAAGMGFAVAVVIGGGNLFRGIKGESLSMERAQADGVGMLATCMNGVILRAALLQAGCAAQLFSALPVGDLGGACRLYARGEALRCLDSGEVAIFTGGTGHPYFTTDTAAALRAAEMGCDALFKATKADGVYASDPDSAGGGGERYDHISYDQALARGLRFMDATALALARDTSMPILLFSFARRGNLGRILKGGGVYTRIDAQGANNAI